MKKSYQPFASKTISCSASKFLKDLSLARGSSPETRDLNYEQLIDLFDTILASTLVSDLLLLWKLHLFVKFFS